LPEEEGRVRVTGVSHIPIGVRDMDESLRFWRDFMGLSVTGDTGRRFDDRRSVFLRWDEEKTSVFVSLSAKQRELDEAVSLGRLGVDHIAFWVEDLDAFVERAQRMAIEMRGGPTVYGRPYADHEHGETFRTAMFVDPNGVAVQLDEWCEPLG
jgi:catechol 2,3-dioxygenase-like lactoylglutathione lyase family enzyme